MISKIIQLEKERQEKILNGCRKCGTNKFLCEYCNLSVSQHKQSLINLKEHMEEEFEFLNNIQTIRPDAMVNEMSYRINIIKEDIQELNKIIKRY